MAEPSIDTNSSDIKLFLSRPDSRLSGLTKPSGLLPVERLAREPDPMKNHRQLPGHRHPRFARSLARLKPQPPALQWTTFPGTGQQHMGRLHQQPTQQPVALLGDRASQLHLTRLMHPWHQPQVRSDLVAAAKPSGIIDGGHKRRRHRWAHPRAHSSAALAADHAGSASSSCGTCDRPPSSHPARS